MSDETAEALAEAHENYVAALLAHVADEQGAEPVEEEDADAERKAELVALTIAELRKQAKDAGASAADIKACGTGNDGKEALADLIIELGDDEPEDPADDGDDGAAAAADDEGAVDEDEPPTEKKAKKDKKPKKKDKVK